MAAEQAHQTDGPRWETLIERVRRIEQRCWTAGEQDAAEPASQRNLWLATGWRIGGGTGPAGRGEPEARQIALRRGALHEWFAMPPSPVERGDGRANAEATDAAADRPPERGDPRSSERPRPSPWPPLCVLGHLAGRALAAHGGAGWVVWIGRGCWPHGRLLWRDRGEAAALLRRSVFVDPPTGAERLWAIDVALRSRAVAAVVADGGGMDMAATRRVQLAARAGGSPALLARPPSERGTLSAAASRWAVAPMPTDADRPRWRIELWRCKEAAHATDGALVSPRAGRRFIVEWNHAAGLVAVPAELVDRSGAPSTAPPIARFDHAAASINAGNRPRPAARRTA